MPTESTLDNHVDRLVAEAPELTPEQAARLRALLPPTPSRAAA
ncbi:MAG: hypothetical protein ACR2JU_14500 [Nocardioidaceae bacterium]